jgi:hypothetical protein
MSDDEREDKMVAALRKYSSTKGPAVTEVKVDKRKESSRINAAKAREAKLAGLAANRQAKKQVRMQEIDASEDDEEDVEDSADSEEEWYLESLKSKKGGKGRAGNPAANDYRIDRLEMMVAKALKVGKKKTPPKKTIINVAPAVDKPDSNREEARKNVTSWF